MSSVTIEFLQDFQDGYSISIQTTLNSVTTERIWDWVVTRSNAYEVTEGTPTGTTGETTAINFETAYDLDLPSGFTTTQTSNSITITSTTAGEDFTGVKVNDGTINQPTYVNVTYNNTVDPPSFANVDLILTRSPHYINIPYTETTTTGVSVSLKFWTGDLSVVPGTVNYQLTKTRPTIDFPQDDINISYLANDFLEPKTNFSQAATVEIVNSETEDAVWLNYVATYIDDQAAVADIEGTFVCVNGYGEYLEGVNPTPSTQLLTNASIRKIQRGNVIVIPFVNRGVITDITVSTENTEINTTVNPSASTESTEYIQYVSIRTADILTDSIITVTTNNNETLVFQLIDECRFEPKHILFKNKNGVFDVVNLFKKSNESLNVNREKFVNNYLENGTYDTSRHQIKYKNIQGQKGFVANSGYINEAENTLYEEMLASDQVYLWDTNLTPINVSTSSIQFKTRINDTLVNYEIEFEYAFNYIQNV